MAGAREPFDATRWNAGGAALRFGIDRLVKLSLRGVWVRGVVPTGPVVWAANHHSWWDFFAAAAALRAAGRKDVGVLMDPMNIGRQGLFGRVGAVGTDHLRTAVGLVEAGMVLVVFPEGEMRNPGPLGPTRRGATWLADRAGAALHPVATRVLLRGQQSAEAYLDIGPPLPPGASLDTELRTRLAALDAELAASDPTRPLPGFVPMARGLRSWNERVRALRGRD
ncbi:1-acyl-sn-glycerol-3-phosphate acyltransferase [Nakamurella flavida]|uniref:1-acyl-sn-glycerol-3-phosphate acyltransferase n=1 Tax=Nakamurella flavida TaxID=363630 RepID=A0A938YLM3_9ACTN|nr:1-acyl-sn-glycerol-3-phosphate acyltransferase [Nakamurella flavida]MBM9475298.1 1-acyl-sn-glycerol-3-phosphate acyltransferase [Nakamurella flavida]MDP9776872.1 1-acyl-sn-glycerol-3-phosphate acyltransferase [Nakamurella flavida]